ncbi:MAG: oxidoreductase [Flavobacteriaceae bacterium]|nr:oxidoreductase [Flavobacteriaceae bacterium]
MIKYKITILILMLIISCAQENNNKNSLGAKNDKVKLMTLNPGHFHAALVHKEMYSQVDSTIYVFAPEGAEVEDFLSKIRSYNAREISPTSWKVETYVKDNYLEKLIEEKPGHVMIIAGKNSKKVDYILEGVKAGLNVYADKPLVIDQAGFEKLLEAFRIAENNGVLIYDIMTERFEVTNVLQKKIALIPEIFGELVEGSPNEPSIRKESVHHFYKYVSGRPLVRPAWFFDVSQQGEGIVDVSTHLIDQIQWKLFSEQVIDTNQIQIISANRWPTILSLEEFQKVTRLKTFPQYLQKDLINNELHVFSNGEIAYRINGKHAKVSVVWHFKAPEGAGDTHYSVMRGSKSNLIIKQGVEEDHKPTLYIEFHEESDVITELEDVINLKLGNQFSNLTAEKVSDTEWKINFLEELRIGHEAHFAQVTLKFLKYLENNSLPDWEVPNMISKYYTTIEGYKKAKRSPQKE